MKFFSLVIELIRLRVRVMKLEARVRTYQQRDARLVEMIDGHLQKQEQESHLKWTN